MTAGTIDRVFARRELPGMLVDVAARALCWSDVEIYIFQSGFKCRWTMAVATCHAPMSSGQWKGRFRMIKLGELFPCFSRMARFAARERAFRALCLHSLAELSLVRIKVTTSARPVLELVLHGCR